MRFDATLFDTYYTVTSAEVQMGTKAKVKVECQGNISLDVIFNGEPVTRKLKEVLHDPSFGCSLHSVSQLEIHVMTTIFSDGKCKISSNGALLAFGEQCRSFNCLSGSPGNTMRENDAVHIAKMQLWNERLCHVHS